MLKIMHYAARCIALWYLMQAQRYLTVSNNSMQCNGAFFSYFFCYFTLCYNRYVTLFAVIFLSNFWIVVDYLLLIVRRLLQFYFISYCLLV